MRVDRSSTAGRERAVVAYPRALADYAIDQGAHRVFVPEELEAMDELSSALTGAPRATDELQEPGIPIERVRAGVPSH